MKRTLIIMLMAAAQISARAGTTIDAASHQAYGANLGWFDWRGDANNGAVIGEYVCSGCIYSANAGWINLGNGAPANGVQYANNSASDFGVNQDSLGNLRGYAYGANIGWINFENTGAPKVDLSTGKLSGYVWSANCGWISLSNTFAYVRTDTVAPGADTNGDGIPDAWELQNFGTLNINPSDDPDHDGMSNLQEYLAGTNPNDAGSSLQITGLSRDTAASTMLQWSAQSTRFYAIQSRSSLTSGSWTDLTVLPSLGANSAGFTDTTTNEFYRIRAFRPLMP